MPPRFNRSDIIRAYQALYNDHRSIFETCRALTQRPSRAYATLHNVGAMPIYCSSMAFTYAYLNVNAAAIYWYNFYRLKMHTLPAVSLAWKIKASVYARKDIFPRAARKRRTASEAAAALDRTLQLRTLKYPHWREYLTGRQKLLKIFNMLQENHSLAGWVYDHVVTNANGEYLSASLDNEFAVSYARKGIHRFDQSHRTKTTLGRWLGRQRYVVDNFNENERATFVAMVVSYLVDVETLFTEVSGIDIACAYQDEYGQRSCMTGKTLSESYVTVYADNPHVVTMLKYSNGRMKARALVWKTREGVTLVDRIYPNSGYHVFQFAEYAKRKGWLIRSHQGQDNNAEFSDETHKIYSVILNATYHCDNLQPYYDSFHYGNFYADGTLRLWTRECGPRMSYFLNTHGGFISHRACRRCGAYLPVPVPPAIDSVCCPGCTEDANPF